jgi:hypothetical protein
MQTGFGIRDAPRLRRYAKHRGQGCANFGGKMRNVDGSC